MEYSLNNQVIITPIDETEFAILIGNDNKVSFNGRRLLGFLSYLGGLKSFGKDDFVTIVCREYNYDINDANLLFEKLVSNSIIVTNKIKTKGESDVLQWMKNGWGVAKLFHDSVVYSDFMLGNKEGFRQQNKAMADIAKRDGQGPPVVKKNYDKEFVALDEPIVESINFFDVLIKRRTKHRFISSIPINKQLLSNIMHFTARAQFIGTGSYFGPLIKRTCPSGGSRHPVEIYPILFNNQDLKKGIYYYNHIKHGLNFIKETDKDTIYNLCQKQVEFNDNAIAFIITNRFVRNFWKYRYPKSYIFSWLDVGHFVQNLILTCKALGLKCFLTPAINVELSNQILDLNNYMMNVQYIL